MEILKKYRVPRKLKKKIPKGVYCYVFNGKTSKIWNEEIKQYTTAFHIKLCPFYFKNSLGYGDCKYLTKKHGTLNGENDELDMCLDDQCKSCGIKNNY